MDSNVFFSPANKISLSANILLAGVSRLYELSSNHVFYGYFDVAVWFKEKNRAEILAADVSEKTKHLIHGSETYGKMPTFPVVIEVTSSDALADIYTLINYKKRLEK